MICLIGTTGLLIPENGFPLHSIAVSREGGLCWRKSGSGIELDLKKPQKAHLAGGQGGTWEGAQVPAGEGKLLPGMGVEWRLWAHLHTSYLVGSPHPLNQCAKGHTHLSP